jgi:hypothetical protein
MRTSRKPCAPSNPVRIFGRALALHPVPFSRKVLLPLISASLALCCVETNRIDKPAVPACTSARRIARHRVQGTALAVLA